MFLSIIPTFGVGMFVALACAPFLRANPVSTYIGTLVVNPLNGAFVYAFDYWVGSLLIGTGKAFFFPGSLVDLKLLGLRLYIGGIIVSGVLSVSSYFAMFALLRWLRSRKESKSKNS